MILGEEGFARGHFDVVVVGGGPAGSTASNILSAAGLSVLLLERFRVPRKKTCAGYLTNRCKLLLDEILGAPLETLIDIVETKRVGLYHRSSHVNSADFKEAMYGVERVDFDALLVEKAVTRGTVLKDEAIIDKIDLSAKEISLTDKSVYTYAHLIGADGANSRVRRTLGLSLKKEHLAICLQGGFPRERLDPAIDWEEQKLFLDYMHKGYGWAFPKKDYIAIGIGLAGFGGSEVRRAFKTFLGDLGLDESMSLGRIEGGVLHARDYLKKPAKDGALLVGDAAGFADPVTGEGIYYAVLSASHAARAVLAGGNVENAYVEACARDVLKDMGQANIVSRLLFETPLFNMAIKRFTTRPESIATFVDCLSGEGTYFQYLGGVVKRRIGLDFL